MTDIFLSYAREDRARAKELADALEQQGWSVWWDRTIQAGQAFDEVIEEALEGARCIIVLWSSNSVSSRWVRSEAEEGADRKILVPVLIHEVRIPLGFKRIQAANLVDWHRSLPHAEFENLVEAISGILGPPSAAQPDLQTKPQAHIYSVRRLVGHRNHVNCVAFSPDGKTLASASGGIYSFAAEEYTVRLWNVSDGKLLRTLEGHTAVVMTVAFSPDGATLASGDTDGIRLWCVSDGKLLRRIENGSTFLACSPDGTTLATQDLTDLTVVLLRRMSDGKLLRTIEAHTSKVRTVAFSPDGKRLASGSGDKTIQLWQVSDGKLLRTLEGHTSSVTTVAFSPDGKTLASGSDDLTLRQWQVSDGKLLRTLEERNSGPVASVAFSPNGERLASASGYGRWLSDNHLRLWRVSDGKLLGKLEGHSGKVNSVAFSPDGKTLASGSNDKTVRLWKLRDPPKGQT